MKKLLGVILAGMLAFAAVPISAEAGDLNTEQNIALPSAEAETYDDPAAQTETVKDSAAQAETVTNSAAQEDANASHESEAEDEDVTVESSVYQAPAQMPTVSYCAHVQNIGWQSEVSNGALAGTTGRSLRVEALKIHIDGDSNLGVSYCAHVQNIGWMNPVSDGAMAGTSGRSLRVEAIKINLTGNDAQYYDIYYCTHVQNYGWMDWMKNGEESGTAGFSYRVEAVEIKIVAKGSAAPARLGSNTIGYATSGGIRKSMSTNSAAASDNAVAPNIFCSTHVQNVGWMNAVSDGATAGTTGRGLRVEALKIYLSGGNVSGSVTYSVHVQDIGWMSPVSDGAIAGTTGRSKRVEAIKISLTGELAEKFDVVYKTHVQDIGWTGWSENGAISGTQGMSKRVEALQIKIVPKGTLSSALNIVLDPGHGGSDGGANGFGANEKTLNLKIAQYCRAELLTYKNVNVYMTRDSDVYVSVDRRPAIAQSYNADFLASLHLNASGGSHSAHGAEVWYPNANYNSNCYSVGQGVANSIENQLAAIGLARRGTFIRNTANGSTYPDGSYSDYYGIIRGGKLRNIPAIISESCYIDNASDYSNFLSSEDKLRRIGVANATGIAQYFRLEKK